MNGFAVLLMTSSLGLATLGPAAAQSNDASAKPAAPGLIYDCTNVSIDYVNDPTLTNAEKLALMDQALSRSLSKFDACQTAAENAANAARDGGDGTDGDGRAGSASSAELNSVASSDMSGDEKPTMDENANGQTPEQSGFLGDEPTVDDKADSQRGGQSSGGKLPEDIPPADNDSVLEAQIRQAAINETDPKVKAQLWNEYRKYKGLPVVN